MCPQLIPPISHTRSLPKPKRTKHCTANRTVSPPRQDQPVIPQELYRNVIEHIVDTRDLCNLSLTSRVCSFEAHRVLYRSIDLAQNTHTPVLWASTILRHPHKAPLVRALTWRFDLSFIVIPDMLLPSLKLIAQALAKLHNLEKLVLVGHPLVMMHPLHTWILDGCTAHLKSFHNSVFPTSAILPFLSKHQHLRHWNQTGISEDTLIIPDHFLPHLTALDVHASTLARLTTQRPLKWIRLKMGHYPARETSCERKAIRSLALFGTTLSTLFIDHAYPMPIDFRLADILALLVESTPNLKALVYTGSPASSGMHPFTKACTDHLAKFSQLKVLVLRNGSQPLRASEKDRLMMAERAFEACPPLQYLVLGGNKLYSYARHQGGDIKALDMDGLDGFDRQSLESFISGT